MKGTIKMPFREKLIIHLLIERENRQKLKEWKESRKEGAA